MISYHGSGTETIQQQKSSGDHSGTVSSGSLPESSMLFLEKGFQSKNLSPFPQHMTFPVLYMLVWINGKRSKRIMPLKACSVTRTLSSSSSAFNSVDSGPISDCGTAVNTSTTPPFVPFGYEPINDRSRYDDDRSDLRPSNEHGQAFLEARRRRNPAAYLPSGRHYIADPDGRPHDARALLRQQGYFSGAFGNFCRGSLRDTTIRDMTEEEHRNTAIRRAFEERFH